MRTSLLTVGFALLLGLAAPAGTVAGSGPSPARAGAVLASPISRFHGIVTNSNRHGRWIDVHVNTSRRVVRFHITRTTRWLSCDWADVERGHPVAIAAHETNGVWLAVAIRAHHDVEATH
jgi:hypothetical protein